MMQVSQKGVMTMTLDKRVEKKIGRAMLWMLPAASLIALIFIVGLGFFTKGVYDNDVGRIIIGVATLFIAGLSLLLGMPRLIAWAIRGDR